MAFNGYRNGLVNGDIPADARANGGPPTSNGVGGQAQAGQPGALEAGQVSRWSHSTDSDPANRARTNSSGDFASNDAVEVHRNAFERRLDARVLNGPDASAAMPGQPPPRLPPPPLPPFVFPGPLPVNQVRDHGPQGFPPPVPAPRVRDRGLLDELGEPRVRQVSLAQLRRETMFIDGELQSPLNMILRPSQEHLAVPGEDIGPRRFYYPRPPDDRQEERLIDLDEAVPPQVEPWRPVRPVDQVPRHPDEERIHVGPAQAPGLAPEEEESRQVDEEDSEAESVVEESVKEPVEEPVEESEEIQEVQEIREVDPVQQAAQQVEQMELKDAHEEVNTVQENVQTAMPANRAAKVSLRRRIRRFFARPRARVRALFRRFRLARAAGAGIDQRVFGGFSGVHGQIEQDQAQSAPSLPIIIGVSRDVLARDDGPVAAADAALAAPEPVAENVAADHVESNGEDGQESDSVLLQDTTVEADEQQEDKQEESEEEEDEETDEEDDSEDEEYEEDEEDDEHGDEQQGGEKGEETEETEDQEDEKEFDKQEKANEGEDNVEESIDEGSYVPNVHQATRAFVLPGFHRRVKSAPSKAQSPSVSVHSEQLEEEGEESSGEGSSSFASVLGPRRVSFIQRWVHGVTQHNPYDKGIARVNEHGQPWQKFAVEGGEGFDEGKTWAAFHDPQAPICGGVEASQTSETYKKFMDQIKQAQIHIDGTKVEMERRKRGVDRLQTKLSQVTEKVEAILDSREPNWGLERDSMYRGMDYLLNDASETRFRKREELYVAKAKIAMAVKTEEYLERAIRHQVLRIMEDAKTASDRDVDTLVQTLVGEEQCWPWGL